MWNLMRFKNQIALQDDNGSKISYEELDDFGLELFSIIKERCLVFSLCSNQIGSVAGYVAFMNHHILPVLLNAHMKKELLDSLLELYQPNYIWIPTEQVKNLPGEIIYEQYDYSLIRTNYLKKHVLHDELGLLLTTSGSTGSPKFVRQSYNNVSINAKQIVEYLELTASERAITTLPMNYTYGLSIINSHLLVGATILLTEKGILQREFWRFFEEAKATSFGGVPYTYEMLERLRFRQMELPSLQYMTQAGGKLSPDLHKKFAEYALEKGKKFIIMYGQCEATARMGYLPAKDSLRKYGSMGISIPGGKFSLIDIDGQEIEDAEVVGELVYIGPNVTMGYAERPEDFMLGDERKGRLETGDMARRDTEGYYFITGRKKRFLKVYGNRVNLDELDGLLKEQYGNLDFCCAGEDDHVYLFITKETEEHIREQYAEKYEHKMLSKFISDKTGLHESAFKVMVIPEIPKNDAGKNQYKELEQYYRI